MKRVSEPIQLKEISRLEKSNTENSKGIRLNDTDSKAVMKLSVVGSDQFFVYGMSQDDQIWKEKSPIQSRITILDSKTWISVDFATEGFNTKSESWFTFEVAIYATPIIGFKSLRIGKYWIDTFKNRDKPCKRFDTSSFRWLNCLDFLTAISR